MFFFRTDANAEIGTGHLMRCRLLAERLRNSNHQCVFLLRNTPSELQKQLLVSGHKVQKITSDSAASLLRAINAYSDAEQARRPVLVADTDQLEIYLPATQRQLRDAGIAVAIITFTNAPHFHADLIHNQNLLALEEPYSTEEYTQLLLGPRFAILSENFRALRATRQPSKPRGTLLLTFGGVDRFDLTRKVLSVITGTEVAFSRLVVVVGRLYRYAISLESLLKAIDCKTELYIDTPHMAHLMARSDLAVTSGGLTTWELMCLGVPNLIISTSERERKTGLKVEERNLCSYLGHAGSVDFASLGGVIADIASDSARLQQLSCAGTELIDGRGCERACDALARLACAR